jgi:hypothetical protein
MAGGGIADLLTQGAGRSGQFHGVQLFDGRLHKHGAIESSVGRPAYIG